MKTTDKFIKTPELLKSEEIILAYPANMTQNDWRAVGGKLFITNQRITFTTNVIDDKLGGKSFYRAREDVDYIFIKERKLSFPELFSGGLINRLREASFSVQYLPKVPRKRLKFFFEES